jgi:hypothetical protein
LHQEDIRRVTRRWVNQETSGGRDGEREVERTRKEDEIVRIKEQFQESKWGVDEVPDRGKEERSWKLNENRDLCIEERSIGIAEEG